MCAAPLSVGWAARLGERRACEHCFSVAVVYGLSLGLVACGDDEPSPAAVPKIVWGMLSLANRAAGSLNGGSLDAQRVLRGRHLLQGV